jgi:hypothetical protein
MELRQAGELGQPVVILETCNLILEDVLYVRTNNDSVNLFIPPKVNGV